jgi:hypothetical protein
MARDNIRATRCRSPRSHDHSHILGKHPDSHSLPDNRQYHHPGGNPSETPVIPIISRSPSTRHASRALLPSGDEPKCTNNSYPQSESPKQNLTPGGESIQVGSYRHQPLTHRQCGS